MRFVSVSLIALCVACSATSPRPLPPRRVAFGPGPGVTPPIQPAPDLPQPAKAPVRTERYLGWTLAADFISLVPLALWMGRPDDVYLPLPALLLPPLIHGAHGESGKAGISLLMRSAMVGGVYLAGRSIESECTEQNNDFCIPIRSFVIAQLAVVPVILIDSLFLARRVREDSAWRRLPLVPSVAPGPNGGFSLSLGSQF